MSELLVNTIKKADGTGSLTVPNATGTVVTTAGATFTGDLTLSSNGIYLGGATSANYLDDYEEGTWTPTLGGTATYNTQEGHYIKVGGLVYITCRIDVNSIGTGSTNRIQGLPFASQYEGALASEALIGLAVTTSFINFRTAGTDIYAFYASTATWTTLGGNPNYLTSGTIVELGGTYKTAS